jgi:hypothetical protein
MHVAFAILGFRYPFCFGGVLRLNRYFDRWHFAIGRDVDFVCIEHYRPYLPKINAGVPRISISQ